MKTPEMWKLITKNRQAKVRRLLNGSVYYLTERGLFRPENRLAGVYCLGIDEEWELVREPVTWQEAIHAWLDGKGLRVELPGGTIITQDTACVLGYHSVIIGRERKKSEVPGFAKDLFTEGKWFVEE